jgi:winged helix DNA-binding protein
VPERVLTTRELNRALLARQLLLERSRLPLVRSLEQVAGLQTQYAPSGYIGLWSRLERFALADLTRAVERRKAVQATLMRSTIHVVTARDYPLFAAGSRAGRQEGWLRYHRGRLGEKEMKAAAALVRSALADGTKHRDELLELVRPHDPTGGTALWNGVGAWIDLVRVPPSGTWERRRADLYATAEDWLGPSDATAEEGIEHLLRRYLQGFGPARLNDAADWAGLSVAALRPAAERLKLRTFRDEEGKELLDLPRSPLPPAETPAPPRFLPTWDATLLVHARRTQILPESFRPLVFSTKTPHSMPTFLVDGAVAGSWRVERTAKKATLVLDPFEPVPRGARAALREEAEAIVRFVEPNAPAYAVGHTGR